MSLSRNSMYEKNPSSSSGSQISWTSFMTSSWGISSPRLASMLSSSNCPNASSTYGERNIVLIGTRDVRGSLSSIPFPLHPSVQALHIPSWSLVVFMARANITSTREKVRLTYAILVMMSQNFIIESAPPIIHIAWIIVSIISMV